MRSRMRKEAAVQTPPEAAVQTPPKTSSPPPFIKTPPEMRPSNFSVTFHSSSPFLSLFAAERSLEPPILWIKGGQSMCVRGAEGARGGSAAARACPREGSGANKSTETAQMATRRVVKFARGRLTPVPSAFHRLKEMVDG
eukprot:CAMPEP_0114123414 /NCGR_PEP_ID=MMETSP0043_2-20121206/8203_1 /TAXON_ID=464988 /ORGANISM="Hemiselmis andersenii, Strain CCMP644" /LENGTH=139 /DNA_ID=CAMNT_0001216169 /DNA_START=565 /DNA_END=981 /DNA_ORIENTATION=+